MPNRAHCATATLSIVHGRGVSFRSSIRSTAILDATRACRPDAQWNPIGFETGRFA
ncbi:MAG: hypothetical protein ACYC35_18285 [Pirellulales bacterium]